MGPTLVDSIGAPVVDGLVVEGGVVLIVRSTGESRLVFESFILARPEKDQGFFGSRGCKPDVVI